MYYSQLLREHKSNLVSQSAPHLSWSAPLHIPHQHFTEHMVHHLLQVVKLLKQIKRFLCNICSTTSQGSEHIEIEPCDLCQDSTSNGSSQRSLSDHTLITSGSCCLNVHDEGKHLKLQNRSCYNCRVHTCTCLCAVPTSEQECPKASTSLYGSAKGKAHYSGRKSLTSCTAWFKLRPRALWLSTNKDSRAEGKYVEIWVSTERERERIRQKREKYRKEQTKLKTERKKKDKTFKVDISEKKTLEKKTCETQTQASQSEGK